MAFKTLQQAYNDVYKTSSQSLGNLSETKKFVKLYEQVHESQNYEGFDSRKSNKVAEFVRDLLVKYYPDYYDQQTRNIRIRQKDNNGVDFLIEKIKTLPDLNSIINNVEFVTVYDVGTPENPSHKFPLVVFDINLYIIPVGKKSINIPTEHELNQTTKIDDIRIGLILTGNSSKFSTPVKEGLPGLFYALEISEFISGTFDDTKNVFEKILDVSYPIRGVNIDKKTLERCKETIKNFSKKLQLKGKLLSDLKNQVNDSISVAALLLKIGFNPLYFIYERGNIYKKIRDIASDVTNIKDIDIWNPSDIYIIRRDMYDNIINIIDQKLSETKDANTQLNILNGLFADKFSPNNITEETPLLGISLKQKRAQRGKAKTYLKNLADKQDIELNLTQQEQGQDIIFYQNQIKSIIINQLIPYLQQHNRNVVINDNIDMNLFDKVSDINYLQPKYGAFKVLNYILSVNDIGIFRSIALASMKINDEETSPSFFKVTGNDKGSAVLENQQFNSVSINGIILLQNIFNLKNKGININVPLKFNSSKGIKQDVIDIAIRTQGGKQVSVEGS